MPTTFKDIMAASRNKFRFSQPAKYDDPFSKETTKAPAMRSKILFSFCTKSGRIKFRQS